MEYTVSNGAPGKRQVSFSCPACQDRLKTPLESAGQEVECPTCGHLLLIPGVSELAAQQAEQAAAEQASQQLRQHQPATSPAPSPSVATAPVRAPSPVGFTVPRPATQITTPAASPVAVTVPHYRGLLTAKSVFWVLAMLCYITAAVGFVAGMCLLIYDFSQPHPAGHGDHSVSMAVSNLVLLVGGVLGTAFYGFVLHVVGELIGAIRDIAVNSFKR
jgi:DNA-directed RNA polymerase subunit RPC12/RpoP